MSMVFISFIVSFVGLLVFFFWKIWELSTGKRILSVDTLNKADLFIKKSLLRLKLSFDVFLSKLKKTPMFIGVFLRGVIGKAGLLKDFIVSKVVDYLDLDNMKNIEKNKGSVSLFLRNISEDKKDKKKDKLDEWSL